MTKNAKESFSSSNEITPDGILNFQKAIKYIRNYKFKILFYHFLRDWNCIECGKAKIISLFCDVYTVMCVGV